MHRAKRKLFKTTDLGALKYKTEHIKKALNVEQT